MDIRTTGGSGNGTQIGDEERRITAATTGRRAAGSSRRAVEEKGESLDVEELREYRTRRSAARSRSRRHVPASSVLLARSGAARAAAAAIGVFLISLVAVRLIHCLGGGALQKSSRRGVSRDASRRLAEAKESLLAAAVEPSSADVEACLKNEAFSADGEGDPPAALPGSTADSADVATAARPSSAGLAWIFSGEVALLAVMYSFILVAILFVSAVVYNTVSAVLAAVIGIATAGAVTAVTYQLLADQRRKALMVPPQTAQQV